jgi:hypothetical protein
MQTSNLESVLYTYIQKQSDLTVYPQLSIYEFFLENCPFMSYDTYAHESNNFFPGMAHLTNCEAGFTIF